MVIGGDRRPACLVLCVRDEESGLLSATVNSSAPLIINYTTAHLSPTTMKIPFLGSPAPPSPDVETIIPKYRVAIAKKKGLLPALVWGENNEANRELLDEVARSIDKGLLHERGTRKPCFGGT